MAYERFCRDVLQAGNLDEIDVLVAADVVTHSPFPGQAPGRAGFKDAMRAFRRAFPKLEVEVRDIVAGGDKVAGYFAVRGKHEGEFMGIPATHEIVSYEEMAIVRFSEGHIVEHWSVADTADMMRVLSEHST